MALDDLLVEVPVPPPGPHIILSFLHRNLSLFYGKIVYIVIMHDDIFFNNCV